MFHLDLVKTEFAPAKCNVAVIEENNYRMPFGKSVTIALQHTSFSNHEN